jgi:hypothetical protein
MTTLTGKKPSATYQDLLQVSNLNNGIDATIRPLEDGGGTLCPLQLSTTKVNINSGFQVGGSDVTSNAAELNLLDGITTLSGSNTGDQTITLTGDVTGSGTGSFAATIANNAVTNAKQAQIATGTVKARTTAGTGDVEDVDIDTTFKTALNLAKGDVGLSNVQNTDTTTTANITDSTDKRFVTDANLTTIGNALVNGDIGSTVQGYDANTAKTNVAQEYTKQQNFNATTLSDAANISWNLDDNQVASVTLAGNRTLDNPTNMKDGATYILTVKQDVTGTRTLSFGSAYKFPGGTAPTLSTGTNQIDIITFISDGTNMYGVAQFNFS